MKQLRKRLAGFTPIKPSKAGKPRLCLTGFTLVEILIDVMIIGLVSAAVFAAYSSGFKTVELAKAKVAAVYLANEKMEEIRNMPYDSLSTEHGPIYPPGNLIDNETVVEKGIQFGVYTVISYVDDPSDGNAEGTIAGKPKDLYPYDYKKVEITVSKQGRSGFLSRLTTNVSAKAAETPTNTGILKICAVDSGSLPIPGALVTISNPTTDPEVYMAVETGDDGCIMIPNLPPDSQNHYQVIVTKNGYSIDQTYPKTAQNPNELQPNLDVFASDVQSQTFVIDKLAKMIVDVVDTSGQAFPNASLHIQGTKRIYFNPDTFKYSQDLTTDGSGHLEIPDMEFDSYSITVPGWQIASTVPYQPISLKAGTTQNVKLVVTNSATSPEIISCAPLSGKVGEVSSLVITGKNFDNAAMVKLVSGGGQEILGTNVSVSHSDSLSADFDLTSTTSGMYDIIITNPNGESVTQSGGFLISN